MESCDHLPFVQRLADQSFLEHLSGKWLAQSCERVLENLVVAQDANLTQLLDHFQTLVVFVCKDQGDLLQQDLLVVTSKTVVENLTVAIHS